MGVIYRAKHFMLKRPAAIKLLHSSKVSPDSLNRFEAEVQLTCGLTSPHTVAVYDYGVTAEGLFYYVMEYLDGITLAQLIQREGPQPEHRVIHFLQQACLSLAEAHANGLIHRDLKPENLMICCRGGLTDTLKILDFGLAKAVNKNLAQDATSGPLAGTPRYMSPEAIVCAQSMDARGDIYSLGAVGYYLLTAEPVFTGRELVELLKSHVHARPETPSARLGRPIDPDLEKLILQCLEKPRDRRPPSAQDLYRRLGECRSAKRQHTVEFSPPKTVEPAPATTQRSLSSLTTLDEQQLGKTFISGR
jgi:serine/threonine-protein kinase